MKKFIAIWVIPGVLALVGVMLVYVWVNRDGSSKLIERLPGTAGPGLLGDEADPMGPIKGELTRFGGVASKLGGSWPRFRGENFDNINRDEHQLAKSWPAEGPKELWSLEVGEGYAGAAVLNGMVYILDYDKANRADAVRCLSLDDGGEIWRYSYPVKVKRYHGMSRTVPAVTGKYIVTLGPKAHVTCLDSQTGEFLWMKNLVGEFSATVPEWYAAQCPLIDNGRAIIATGGDALLIAVDCATGEVVWKSPNPLGWKMTHSSIMPAELGGKRMYIYLGSGGVAGISAEDGSILWQSTDWQIRIATVASPLVIREGKIFLSGGYNSGSMMLEIKNQQDLLTAEPSFKLKADVFGATQHTPIFYEGYIYGVRPDGQLVCLSTDGRVVWTSGSGKRFGIGPYMIANGLIYAMNDVGVLTLIKATPAGYRQLARAKVLEGDESWGPMAVASGRLILRDLKRMICLDIREQ